MIVHYLRNSHLSYLTILLTLKNKHFDSFIQIDSLSLRSLWARHRSRPYWPIVFWCSPISTLLFFPSDRYHGSEQKQEPLSAATFAQFWRSGGHVGCEFNVERRPIFWCQFKWCCKQRRFAFWQCPIRNASVAFFLDYNASLAAAADATLREANAVAQQADFM